jgi:CBS-domain-containing membrane protein
MLTAGDIMTREVITVKKDTGLKALARILSEHHINGVPVVDEKGRLTGIICESDLIRKNKKLHIPTVVALFDAVFYLESPKKMEEELKRLNATRVEDLYTQKVVTVDVNTHVDEIATLMSEKKIYTLPVMEDDRLVGVIGKADLIRALVR